MGWRNEIDNARSKINNALTRLRQIPPGVTDATTASLIQQATNDLRSALTELDDMERHVKRDLRG